jgi:surface protein
MNSSLLSLVLHSLLLLLPGIISFIQASLPFSTIWDTRLTSPTSSNSTQIMLPLILGNTYNFFIDWGDNTNNTITSPSQNVHDYKSPGIYRINMTGIVNGWQFNNNGDILKLKQISCWGQLMLGSTGAFFFGCANLVITAVDPFIVPPTLSLAFAGCTSLVTIPNLSHWNTSLIINMSAAFQGATNFNSPGVGSFDMVNVKYASSMFQGCAYFNQVIGTWNTVSLLLMDNMFNGCRAFNSDISYFTTSRVTTMKGIFQSTNSFRVNVTYWDTASVADMSYAFYGVSFLLRPFFANLYFFGVSLN